MTLQALFVIFLCMVAPCSGKWVLGLPVGCATKCGVAEGKSGMAGAVTCDTSSCDADKKPDPKPCPKTVDCGNWIREEATACDKCEPGAARTGTAGVVKCSTSSCDANTKPDAKLCSNTDDCGNWVQAAPTGCNARCGTGAGQSGSPGAVKCSTSACDPETKPNPKPCPKTDDCGKWVLGLPVGCATKCGVAEGKSGLAGAVTCKPSICDPDTKPAAKQCPKTVDCGKWILGEATACDKCEAGAARTGTAGTVTCSTSECDPKTKPDAKLCSETFDCGAWIRDEPSGCPQQCEANNPTGTPGDVRCSSAKIKCDPNTKPSARLCCEPATTAPKATKPKATQPKATQPKATQSKASTAPKSEKDPASNKKPNQDALASTAPKQTTQAHVQDAGWLNPVNSAIVTTAVIIISLVY